MPSLGEAAAVVRVRPVAEDEAFLLAALHLQTLLRAGRPVDQGPPTHVQSFAQAWRLRSADLPAWVAELDDQHVGLAICEVPMLPLLGRDVPAIVALHPVADDDAVAEAVSLALVRAVVDWCGQRGHAGVDVAPQVHLPPAVLDAARADVVTRPLVSLPTRP